MKQSAVNAVSACLRFLTITALYKSTYLLVSGQEEKGALPVNSKTF